MGNEKSYIKHFSKEVPARWFIGVNKVYIGLVH